eukprot:gene5859-5769_t
MAGSPLVAFVAFAVGCLLSAMVTSMMPRHVEVHPVDCLALPADESSCPPCPAVIKATSTSATHHDDEQSSDGSIELHGDDGDDGGEDDGSDPVEQFRAR